MLIFTADSLDGSSNLSHKVHGYAIISKSDDLIRSTSKCWDLGQVRSVVCFLNRSWKIDWMAFSLDVGFKYFAVSHCVSKGLQFLAKNPRTSYFQCWISKCQEGQERRKPKKCVFWTLIYLLTWFVSRVAWHTVDGRNLATLNTWTFKGVPIKP